MRELIGQTLGQYKIVEQVGQGGMAVVFKARQLGLERWVAVKVLPPHYAADPDFSRYFVREAQAIAQLEHPHILPVYDFGQRGEYTYLVMRYIEGSRSLADVMERAIPIDRALTYLKQLASALDYAHQRGIIHRDIKPANILLNNDWLFLADFGLARVIRTNAQLITTGLMLGTPAYMSPEQGSGSKIDVTSDIYALGVIVYAMLTGYIPHSAETTQAIIYKRTYEPAPSLRMVAPHVPVAVERVVQKALAPNPAKRFQRAGDFIEALDRAVREESSLHLRTVPVRSGPAPASPLANNRPISPTPPAPQPACPSCGRPVRFGAAACPSCGLPLLRPTPAAAPDLSRRRWWLVGIIGILVVTMLLVVAGIWALTRQFSGPASQIPVSGISLPEAPAETTGDRLFFDDFDGVGLNSSTWRYTLGGGQIQVYDSTLRLSSAGQSFPLVLSAINPFPGQGNFRLQLSERHLHAADRGSGIVIGTLPENYQASQNNETLLDGLIIGLWQDAGSWRILTALDDQAYTISAPKLDINELQIDYVNEVYRVKLNGEEVYVSEPMATRPAVLWIGSPAQAGAGGEWSNLEVGYISVESLPDLAADAPIPSPTATVAEPTATPEPEATATPAPQICETAAAAPFAVIWQETRDLLGCPAGDLTVIPTIAEEAFQGGHLFWRSDTDGVYIILDRQFDGAELNQGQWQPARPEWRWDGSDPEGVGMTPPPGLVEPKRGFGWLWRNHLGGPEGPLGWALDREYGFDNTGQAQAFDRGIIFKGSTPRTYILLADGTFYTQ